MGGLVTDGYCILEEPDRVIKIPAPTKIEMAPEIEVARFPAMIHAVKVMSDALTAGRLPSDVTTACGRQMPRSTVKQDSSWKDRLTLGDRAALCEVCEEKVAGERRGKASS
ncbi:MAG: hypothetical protein ABR972_08030 [Acidimicrobiales bacterium]|jgi:hypothetical protein